MPQRHSLRLPIPRNIQKTWFSCGPSCLQMMVAADGVRLSHLEAIRLLQAFPNGTDMHYSVASTGPCRGAGCDRLPSLA